MDKHIEQKISDFFKQYTQVTFQPSEIIIRAEENPSEIVLLQEGVVRQYSISPDGEELTVNLYKPVSFFPLMYIVNDMHNRYYFEALSEVKGWKAPKAKVIEFLKQHNDVMYELIQRLYKGMDALLLRMEHILIGNAQTKVIFTLLNAAYRFGKSDEVGVHLSLKMTHKDLSTMSGMARETFSREIKKLERKGLVKVDGHMITLTNIEALQEVLISA